MEPLPRAEEIRRDCRAVAALWAANDGLPAEREESAVKLCVRSRSVKYLEGG